MNRTACIVGPGSVCHIKDSYFQTANDSKLMLNHDGGAFRPTYICAKDDSGILWAVPLSSRVDKFKCIVAGDVARHGKCIRVYLSKFAKKDAAFLLQNMFPVLPKYIDHVHTVNGEAVTVPVPTQKAVFALHREARRLSARNVKVVYPDIEKLENMMLSELSRDTGRVRDDTDNRVVSIHDRLAAAKAESERLSAGRAAQKTHTHSGRYAI